jgi:hypothetical protein
MPLGVAVQLLPTPVVNDMGAGKTPDAWDEWTDRMKAGHANGNGHGPSLSIEVARLLPTPRTTDSHGPGEHEQGGADLRTTISLLPTPCARDHKDSTASPAALARHSPPIVALLPTPTAVTRDRSEEEIESRRNERSNGQNLDMLPWSGGLTAPPSRAGKPSSDDQLPGQLSLDATASD